MYNRMALRARKCSSHGDVRSVVAKSMKNNSGKKDSVSRIRKHPLFRALRVDKLKLTALEATLKLYLDRERLFRELPTLRMISMPIEECALRAEALSGMLRSIPGLSVEILDDSSEFGGGSVPTQQIPTRVVAIRHDNRSLEALYEALRLGRPSPRSGAR